MINYIKNKIAQHKAKKYVTDGPVYGPSRLKSNEFGKFPHWITGESIGEAGIRQAVDVKIFLDGEEVGFVKAAYPSPYPKFISRVITYAKDVDGNAYLDDCEEFALKRLEGIVTYSVSLKP